MDFWSAVIWYGVLALVFGVALPLVLYILYRMIRGATSRDWIYNPSPDDLKSYQARVSRMGEEQVIAAYQRRCSRFRKAMLLAVAAMLMGFVGSRFKDSIWASGAAPAGFILGAIGIAVASFSLRCPVCGKTPAVTRSFQATLSLQQCEICGARLAPRD